VDLLTQELTEIKIVFDAQMVVFLKKKDEEMFSKII
jgi:hypothetical protein